MKLWFFVEKKQKIFNLEEVLIEKNRFSKFLY